uniref:Uncharacterized protein ycf23 n=1 Tax=Caloglossa beccarii TaxID=131038 RepID=A0A1Z1M824_9FLOR|nr:hypothetical protein [Caloglossa beccarii]ARW62237.1 hypothetical protein [Caloglossa beccarii]
MNLFYIKLLDSFKSKKIIKVISGLETFNIGKIYKMLKAADIAQASYIDLPANIKIISFLKKVTNLPLCVSSIDPLELYNCVMNGANIVEIGNFDIFYEKQINFSAFDILELAIETRKLVYSKDICVTIPHILNLYEQSYLAKKLEKLGINFLQTEGLHWDIDNSYIAVHNYKYDMISKSCHIASPTLSSTYLVSSSVNIPVIASSKINCISSSVAFSNGASGIGIKSAIYHRTTIYQMSLYLSEIFYMTDVFIKLHYKPQLICGINKNKIRIQKQIVY